MNYKWPVWLEWLVTIAMIVHILANYDEAKYGAWSMAYDVGIIEMQYYEEGD